MGRGSVRANPAADTGADKHEGRNDVRLRRARNDMECLPAGSGIRRFAFVVPSVPSLCTPKAVAKISRRLGGQPTCRHRDDRRGITNINFAKIAALAPLRTTRPPVRGIALARVSPLKGLVVARGGLSEPAGPRQGAALARQAPVAFDDKPQGHGSVAAWRVHWAGEA